MAEQAVVFDCEGAQLIGVVHRPDAVGPATGVLVVVGGPQYRVGSHRQFTLMARALAAQGSAVMRFDLRGMGDGAGASIGFEHAARDLAAGIEAFRASVPSLERLVLWGLCDGASSILLHGCRDPRVQGLILVNPWVHSEAREAGSYVRYYYGRRLMQRSFWRKLLSLQVDVPGSVADWLRRLVVSRGGDGGTPYVERMLAGLRAFPGNVLILLSEHDLVARQFEELCRVQPDWGRAIARAGITIHSVAGADHTFSERAVLDDVSRVCARWLAENRMTAS